MVAYTFIFFISSDATVILKRFRLHYSISLLVRLGIIAQPFFFYQSATYITFLYFISYALHLNETKGGKHLFPRRVGFSLLLTAGVL